jgi:hypothetical protein
MQKIAEILSRQSPIVERFCLGLKAPGIRRARKELPRGRRAFTEIGK